MRELLRAWFGSYILVGMSLMQIYALVWFARDLSSHFGGRGCCMPRIDRWIINILGWSFVWPYFLYKYLSK